jgi:ribose-phosphate pyrophosphokinase
MDKIRDQETGGITSLRMNTSGGCNHYIKNKNILIVDDICDGGRTFIECAKILHLHEVNSVSLYVTHGIFSKGLAPLEDAGITEIYTKDGLRSCPF